ncbi:MAG TPA: hypothetical protein VN780_01530 [Candidatus Eisenbacteria bacterium]|nr:hypothetical protein [Candidatus Eisenbacteria bacterium]
MTRIRSSTLAILLACAAMLAWPLKSGTAQDQNVESEIIANLAGGRVIVHVARDEIIVFGVINQPIEAGSIPPRVMDLDSGHVGILMGAAEWRLPADPKPVRLDHDFQRIGGRDPRFTPGSGDAEPDLEAIGVSFLERLRPLTAQLHHKLEVGSDEPLFEVVVIGYAPRHYGPEIWTIEYRIKQQQVGAREEYWQTQILRPRFEQIYPPEKHAPRTIVEALYPPSSKTPTLMNLIEGNDPRIAQLRGGEPRFAKVVDSVSRGQAQKAVPEDSADFLRALLPILAGKNSFALGKMEEGRGVDWVVEPQEPVDKAQKAKEEKERPPDAPTLRKRPNPN